MIKKCRYVLGNQHNGAEVGHICTIAYNHTTGLQNLCRIMTSASSRGVLRSHLFLAWYSSLEMIMSRIFYNKSLSIISRSCKANYSHAIISFALKIKLLFRLVLLCYLRPSLWFSFKTFPPFLM